MKFTKTLLQRIRLKQPISATLSEWQDWENQARAEHPVRYWLTETLPDTVRGAWHLFWQPVSDVRWWFYNRWISQPHVLRTGLDRGRYWETDDRILHGCFHTLREFVEYDKAWMEMSSPNSPKLTAWQKFQWRWLRGPRSAQAGQAYLTWESQLVYTSDFITDDQDPRIGQPTTQAENAREILDLYDWWVNRRPQRDTHPLRQALDQFNDNLHRKYPRFRDFYCQPGPEQDRWRDLVDQIHALEEQEHQEDQDCLIRLMRIRRSLWT